MSKNLEIIKKEQVSEEELKFIKDGNSILVKYPLEKIHYETRRGNAIIKNPFIVMAGVNEIETDLYYMTITAFYNLIEATYKRPYSIQFRNLGEGFYFIYYVGKSKAVIDYKMKPKIISAIEKSTHYDVIGELNFVYVVGKDDKKRTSSGLEFERIFKDSDYFGEDMDFLYNIVEHGDFKIKIVKDLAESKLRDYWFIEELRNITRTLLENKGQTLDDFKEFKTYHEVIQNTILSHTDEIKSRVKKEINEDRIVSLEGELKDIEFDFNLNVLDCGFNFLEIVDENYKILEKQYPDLELQSIVYLSSQVVPDTYFLSTIIGKPFYKILEDIVNKYSEVKVRSRHRYD